MAYGDIFGGGLGLNISRRARRVSDLTIVKILLRCGVVCAKDDGVEVKEEVAMRRCGGEVCLRGGKRGTRR